MKRWLLLPFVLLLSGLAVAAEQPELKPVNIGYVRVMDDSQVLVAKEAGFFKDAGLDANLVEFSSGTDAIKAIISGQLDYGVMGFSNAFTWASRGADLRIVGGAQRGFHAILTRDDSGIKTVADLKGHSLASQKQGSTADIVLKGVVLAGAGLTPDDLRIMSTKPAIAVQALVRGSVDAAFLFEPYARIALAEAPVSEIYEIGDVWPFPCMVVITTADTLKNKKDVLWAAMDAQRKAIKLLSDKPAEAAHLISHYFIAEPTLKTPNGEIPRDKIIKEAIVSQTFSAKLTKQDLKRMHELKDIMVKQGIIQPNSLNVNKIVDLDWQQARDL